MVAFQGDIGSNRLGIIERIYPPIAVLKALIPRRWLRCRALTSAQDWWLNLSPITNELLMLGGGLLLACGMSYAAWRLSGPHWREWKARQAITQSHRFIEGKDYSNAVLALRRATQAKPDDSQVWREAAELLSRMGSPEAVTARRNLAHLNPGETESKIALITEALKFYDLETAKDGLAELEKTARNDIATLRLAVATALAVGEKANLERRLAELVRADPTDADARFNLYALRLQSMDAKQAAEAERKMRQLSAIPELRLRVALERLKLAAVTRNPLKVDAEVADLLGELGPSRSDVLAMSDTEGEPPGWSALQNALEREAARNGAKDTALLMRWHGELGQGTRALAWLDGLPPELRAAPETRTAAADLAAKLDDLPRLRALLKSGALGPLSNDTVTLAVAARVQMLRMGPDRGRSAWNETVASAGASTQALRALARLAVAWHDTYAMDLALQAIVERNPRERWAFEMLRASYAAQRDMEKLWRLHQAWAPHAPRDKEVQRTWVMLGVLLQRETPQQRAIIEGILAAEGERPSAATLLAAAAARWRSGDAAAAAVALDRLPVEATADPSAWMWRTVVAADRDDESGVRDNLGRFDGERLSKEEKQVLAGALEALRNRKLAAEREAVRKE